MVTTTTDVIYGGTRVPVPHVLDWGSVPHFSGHSWRICCCQQRWSADIKLH